MKKNQTIYQYFCLLLFALSSHSLFKGSCAESFTESFSESQSAYAQDDDDDSGFDFFREPVAKQNREKIKIERFASQESIIKKLLTIHPRFIPSHYIEVVDPRLLSHSPVIDYENLITAYFQQNRFKKRTARLVQDDDSRILKSNIAVISGYGAAGGSGVAGGAIGRAIPIVGAVIIVVEGIKYLIEFFKKNGDGDGGKNPKDPKDKKGNAQAPGVPTEKDGFIPKKNWDGEKVKHPRGWGWPDKDGNVWIPSGPRGHGSPHWDVQRPGKSKDYENIVPGGKIRGQK